MRRLTVGLLALLALGAVTASAASAKQVGLFEAQTGKQVSASQKLGTSVTDELEGGRAECHAASAGDLEPPLFAPPPLKTTIFYSGSPTSSECSSEVAGETIQMYDLVPDKIEVTGLTMATVHGSASLYEYQPGGLYCVYGGYAGPFKEHLASPSSMDRSEWTGTVVLKRDHRGGDSGCAETVSSTVTIDVGGQESWAGEALETKKVS